MKSAVHASFSFYFFFKGFDYFCASRVVLEWSHEVISKSEMFGDMYEYGEIEETK